MKIELTVEDLAVLMMGGHCIINDVVVMIDPDFLRLPLADLVLEIKTTTKWII